MVEKTAGLPVKQDMLLEAGVHIGTMIRTNDMKEFVFKRRNDGLYILDIRKTAERLIEAAKLLARYNPENVLIVASRIYSSGPASRFSALTGIPVVKGRFVPGTMTNLSSKNFKEPEIILVCDPKGERAAISESAKNGVPVIALCDTDNETKFIDFVIPINNKGRRSLALVFYILSRELMLAQEKISSYDEFKYDLGYFEKMIEEKEEKAPEAAEEVKTEEEKPKETKEEPKKEEKAKEEPKEKPKETKEKPKEEEKEAPKEEKEAPKKEEKKAPRKKAKKKKEKPKETKEEPKKEEKKK